MREKSIIPRRGKSLMAGLLLLLLSLPGVMASAAPPLQGEPTATSTPTTEVRVTATLDPASPTPIPPPCAIEGYVFQDANGNQQYEGEPGLPTTLTLQEESDGSVIATQSTGASGYFCFATGSVEPGSYRLVQQKVAGYETTGGQERQVTVNLYATANVSFPNIQVTPTPLATATTDPARATATAGPTFTATPTASPSPSTTLTPSTTPPPTNTPLPTGTPTETPSATPTASPSSTATATTTSTSTATPTQTRTPTVTATLRSLTPIATYITTTPGVLVTVTSSATPAGGGAGPVGPIPGGPQPPVPTPINRLPTTGSGSGNNVLLALTTLGLLAVGAGLVRRLFLSR